MVPEGGEWLRVWESDRWMVVMGRSCRVDEVDRAACAADGVAVVRRESGGGTVVVGPGCVNYAVRMDLDQRPELLAVEASYALLLEGLARRLECTVAGSDLMMGDRKVSGNAQRRTRGWLLHHGTLLCGMDLERVTRYLREPARRPEHRGRRTHAEFLINLSFPGEQVRERLRQWGMELGLEESDGEPAWGGSLHVVE